MFSAYQLDADQIVILPDGHGVRGFAGEWAVCRHDKVLDVFSPARFEALYAPVAEPTLVLTATDQAAVEKALGFGATTSSESLRSAVERVAALKIGDISVTFSVQQWQEITRRADKRHQSVAQYLAALVDRFTQDLWTLG